LAVAHFKLAPNLIDLQLGDRPLVGLGGLPAGLSQPAGDHHPVAFERESAGVGERSSGVVDQVADDLA
jgi:hypothetical protein